MKQILTFLFLSVTPTFTQAQQVENIFFHLYTDSLKKGSWNYINIDGKLSNGKWKPLTHKEIEFNVSAGKLEGNSIWIDWDFKHDSVHITATLKEKTSIRKEITVWIKKFDPQMDFRTAENALPSSSPVVPANKRRRKQ